MRAAKTRNLNTISEAAYWGLVRSGLRRTFRFWKPAMAALRAARISAPGPRGRKWLFVCAGCGRKFLQKGVQVDHKVPTGKLTDYAHVAEFLRRLTPESPDDFQVMCKPCHQTKTNNEKIKA